MGTIKVPSTVEYVLFPAERHFRRLREDAGRDVHRLKRNYKGRESMVEKEGRIGGTRNEEMTEESETRKTSSVVRDNAQPHPRRTLCVPLDGIPGSLNYNDPLPSH